MKENNTGNPGRVEKKLMKCEDIQPMIFDYMNHELGEGRSAITREHLRKCKECQEIARNIKSTLDLLHKSSKKPSQQAERLSESRRKKIIWTFTHPVRSWIQSNKVIFSFVMTMLVFAGVFSLSRFLIEMHYRPIVDTDGECKIIKVMLFNPGQTNIDEEEIKKWLSDDSTNVFKPGVERREEKK